MTVSLACVLYMVSSFDLIDEDIANQDLLSAIALCLHDLQPYANDHWFDHLIDMFDPNAESCILANEIPSLHQALESLVMRYNDMSIKKFGDSNDEDETPIAQGRPWDPLELSAPAYNLLDKTLLHWRKRSPNIDSVTSPSCMWLQMPPLEFL